MFTKNIRNRLSTNDYWFVACLSTAFIPIIPLLLGFAYPKHDTLYSFQSFSYIYSAAQGFGEFPAWVPYLLFGQTTSLYDLIANGPAQYLMMFVGLLINTNNDLMLWVFALLLSNITLMVGVVLLSKEYAFSNLETFYVCIVSMILSDVHIQIDMNFNTYNQLPLMFWLFLRFIKSAEYKYLLWLFAFCSSFLIFGKGSYNIIVVFYTFLAWSLLYSVYYSHTFINRCRYKDYIKTQAGSLKKLLPVVVGAGILCLIFLFKVDEITDNYVFHAIGRDIVTGEVGLSAFLSCGGYTSLIKFVSLVSRPDPSHYFSLFVGKIIFACVILAILYSKHMTSDERINFAFLLAIASLIILFTSPAASPITSLSYHLPGMNKVRNVCYYGPIAKLLFIFMAVYGMRILVRIGKSEGIAIILITLSILCFISFIRHESFISLISFIRLDSTALLITVAAVFLIFLPKKYIYSGVIVLSILETSTSVVLDTNWERLYGKGIRQPYSISGNNDITFPEKRIYPNHAKVLFDYLTQTSPHTARYGIEAAFVREDYCWPSARQDAYLKNINEFWEILHPENKWEKTLALKSERDILHPKYPWDILYPKNKTDWINEPRENRVRYGCEENKLRFADNILWANDESEAMEILRKVTAKRNDDVVLIGDKRLNYPQSPSADRIEVIEFTPNRLSVSAQGPGWLVYRDAIHPWWAVKVDDVPSELVTADIAFKSVYIPDGEHQVMFEIKQWVRLTMILQAGLLAISQIVFLVVSWFRVRSALKDSVA